MTPLSDGAARHLTAAQSDVAELTAADIRNRLSALNGVCAQPDRDRHVEQIVAELTTAFAKEQAVCDEETACGTNPQTQQKWQARVERR